jgi:hypothetical protein
VPEFAIVLAVGALFDNFFATGTLHAALLTEMKTKVNHVVLLDNLFAAAVAFRAFLRLAVAALRSTVLLKEFTD